MGIFSQTHMNLGGGVLGDPQVRTNLSIHVQGVHL